MSIEHITDEFGWWFPGFFDGEGHLQACYYPRKNKEYMRISNSIILTQRLDNYFLVLRIQEFRCSRKMLHRELIHALFVNIKQKIQERFLLFMAQDMLSAKIVLIVL